MSTSTLVGNLAKIRDTGDQAELDNRSLQAHMNFGMTMAGYANSYAQNQMKEKITFARSTSETPEEFNLRLDQIRKDNPVLGKLAAKQIERGKVEAEVMDYQRQAKLRKMGEDGFLSGLAGEATTFDYYEDYKNHYNESVSRFQKQNPNTSADFTLKADQLLNNNIHNSFRKRSQAANLKTLSNFTGTIMADLPQNITLGAAQEIYTDVLDQSKTIFGNVVGEQKARNAIKSQLEYATDPEMINRFYEAGILTDRDSKVLKAQVNSRVAANKRGGQGMLQDYEAEVYKNSAKIGIPTDYTFMDKAYSDANEVILNNNEIISKTISEGLTDVFNMPESNSRRVLTDALMQRQELIKRDPITYLSLSKGLSQDSLDAVSNFVPIQMDNDSHVLDKSAHINNIAARLDAVKQAQFDSGIQTEAVFSPEQASENTDQFNRLSLNDKQKLVTDYTGLIQSKGMNKKILDNLTGDANYRTYADLQKLKNPNSNKFLNNYLALQDKDNSKIANGKYKDARRKIERSVNFLPASTDDGDITNLASKYVMAVTDNYESGNIDTSKLLDFIATKSNVHAAGNSDLILLKGTEKSLENNIKSNPYVADFFKEGEKKNLNNLRKNNIVEQIDFTTFKVYSPNKPPVTLFLEP